MLQDFFISFGNFSSKAASANSAMQYVVPILAPAGLFRCAEDFFTKNIIEMVLSMTGFGKSSCELGNKKVVVEIKSLNSKQLDMTSRVPAAYKEKDIELRNIVAQKLERGKVEFSMFVENVGKETSAQINMPILEAYHAQLKEAAERLGVEPPADWFAVLLKMPEVMKVEAQEIDEDEWKEIANAFECAVDNLVDFRRQEGVSLQKVFEAKIKNIRGLLAEVEPFEKERIEKVKTRIRENLEALNLDYDKNRFEQELIFYIEKLDVNEEKNRLAQHLKYFEETMASGECAVGKKLGFIAQEIGREINTLGSKSNHSEMQKIVVKMKDELEQIKEQVLNVL